ncbi:hypothetical protein FD754_014814 [Muntiacus muntjak]|uniref:Uncharacterized protein n=1 Tax=Muntiacus muntjak TaxID=9888 RepID=A0A5N3VL03_MUNMU|nr:hypothetical protein FD754_014814 [Muntiacus muntjak]
MVLTAFLGTGLIYLTQDGDDDLENTPLGNSAKDSLIFSTSGKSTEVNYASILGVSNTKTLLEWVQALTVTQDSGTQIPYSKPSRSDQLPGQHPGRNCLRREYEADPVTPPGQSHAAAVLPEDS